MSFAWAGRVALAVALCTGGCTQKSDSAEPTPMGAPPSTGISLTFDVGGVLLATPSQSIDIGVVLTGIPDQAVTVWLEGDYSDASLGASDIVTKGGKGTARLLAPSVPATFTLR